jgi:hypothetical protein
VSWSHEAHLYFLGVVPQAEEAALGFPEDSVEKGKDQREPEKGKYHFKGQLIKGCRAHFLLELVLLAELIPLQTEWQRGVLLAAHPPALPHLALPH